MYEENRSREMFLEECEAASVLRSDHVQNSILKQKLRSLCNKNKPLTFAGVYILTVSPPQLLFHY